MIKKVNKLINNKFPRFFKFIFFLRYLFLIFFISITIFLTLPNFFDFKSKEEIIKSYLLKDYNLHINNIENINFNSFPLPSLNLSNLEIKFNSNDTKLITDKLIIYPRFLSIYNFESFKARKIKLQNIEVSTALNNIYSLVRSFSKVKGKLEVNNLNLNFKEANVSVISIKKIDFKNFGFKKDKIKGNVFDKKFKINLYDDFKKINFELFETGVSLTINFFENSKSSDLVGNVKGKFLKSNFNFDFRFNKTSLKVDNFLFRNKKLSFDSKGLIVVKPYLQANLKSNIKNIENDLFKKIDINNLLESKVIIKKINTEQNIIFENNKYKRTMVDYLNLNMNFAYGRLNISKNIKISDSDFKCSGDVNLIDEYPILFFNCFIISKNKKKLFKKFKVNYKKTDSFNLNVKGSLNILNNKINFKQISIDDDYFVNKEDLKYFKDTFENILFDENFIRIFSLQKIKNFIIEIL